VWHGARPAVHRHGLARPVWPVYNSETPQLPQSPSPSVPDSHSPTPLDPDSSSPRDPVPSPTPNPNPSTLPRHHRRRPPQYRPAPRLPSALPPPPIEDEGTKLKHQRHGGGHESPLRRAPAALRGASTSSVGRPQPLRHTAHRRPSGFEHHVRRSSAVVPHHPDPARRAEPLLRTDTSCRPHPHLGHTLNSSSTARHGRIGLRFRLHQRQSSGLWVRRGR
jgi:hypothetical protein